MIKKGFTLAEILITITVIGVVAALTLPHLNNNIAKQALEKSTLKFYTQLSKALDIYLAENDADLLSDTDFTATKFVEKYFDVVGKCDQRSDCLPDQYTNIDSNKTYSANELFGSSNTYYLADGAVFSIYEDGTDIKKANFDVNGKKGPNKIGYDMWSVHIYDDGSVDEYGITPEIRLKNNGKDAKQKAEEAFARCKSSDYSGCFGHFMRNGFKFDY